MHKDLRQRHGRTPTGPNQRRRARVAFVGLGALTLLSTGCGSATGPVLSGPEPVTSSPTAGASDAASLVADRPFELNLDLPTDKTTAFNLQLPPEAVAAAMEQPSSADAPADTEPDQATAAPEQQPTPHHLEEIVIDDIPDELRPPFVWDEAAALTCAHAEFALDALIAEDDGALDETLDQAADWATQSDNSEVSVYAGGLASTRGLADAEALVIDVLSTCTSAGYEL